MNQNTDYERPGSFHSGNRRRERILQFLIVFGMGAMGILMMAGGFLAWTAGENNLLLAGFLTGAIFTSAGGLGFVKCLDEMVTK